MPAFNDKTGRRYGRLVVERLHARDKWHKAKWFCRCDCGWQKVILGSDLESGRTQSCGCLQKENASRLTFKHGNASPSNGGKSPTYFSWCAMMTRCYNPTNHNYPNYGKRGIRVCDEWHTFSIFLADVGERPPGKTLDRIRVNENYEPGNVRWATPVEQRANQRPRTKESFKRKKRNAERETDGNLAAQETSSSGDRPSNAA